MVLYFYIELTKKECVGLQQIFTGKEISHGPHRSTSKQHVFRIRDHVSYCQHFCQFNESMKPEKGATALYLRDRLHKNRTQIPSKEIQLFGRTCMEAMKSYLSTSCSVNYK